MIVRNRTVYGLLIIHSPGIALFARDPFWRILQLQITSSSFHSLGIALRLTADRDPFLEYLAKPS